jgi:AcrR family transcriptional regulator
VNGRRTNWAWERVSTNAIARALGRSATALYRCFNNRDDILAAARTAAFDRLSDRLEAAMDVPGDIWSRLRAFGNAYVDFASEQLHAYRLIFALDHHAPGQYPDLDRAHARGRANMTRYVERMVDEGKVSGDPQLLAHVFWVGAARCDLAADGGQAQRRRARLPNDSPRHGPPHRPQRAGPTGSVNGGGLAHRRPADAYFPVNTGFRFCRKAATPSS